MYSEVSTACGPGRLWCLALILLQNRKKFICLKVVSLILALFCAAACPGGGCWVEVALQNHAGLVLSGCCPVEPGTGQKIKVTWRTNTVRPCFKLGPYSCKGSSPTAHSLDRQLVPSCLCTPGTIGPALFQARLCQEFCSLFQLPTLVGLLRCSEH